MRKRFTVTYDTVTAESARAGDAADYGFIRSDSLRVSMVGVIGANGAQAKADCAMSLRDAVKLVSGPFEHSEGSISESFYEMDSRPNFETGSSERRALHCPDRITESSLARVCRLLGVRVSS